MKGDMRVFGKIIYYDKKTIDEYKSIIKGQRQLEVEEYEVSNDKGATVDLRAISADAKASKKYVAKVVESLLYDCDEFEKMLAGRDDYFDFTLEDGYDLTTVPRGSIVKLNAFLEIPEGFDLMQLIDTFKPFLMDSLEGEPMEKSEEDALKSVLGNAKATKIPVIVDVDGYTLCAKIHNDNLILEYQEFEELDDEITLLARVSSTTIGKQKPFYDPLKDFIVMNRMLRRSMDDRGEELKAFTVDSDYRQIDILAIYQ